MKKMILWVGAGAVVASCAGIQFQRSTMTDPGQLLFNGHTKPSVDCYRCHNGDARGSGRGPDLAKVAAAMPVEGMVAVIEKGKGFMPAFGDATTPEERQQIALWLRTTFAGPDATKPAPAVEVEPVSEPAPAPATTPEPSATPAANAQPPAR